MDYCNHCWTRFATGQLTYEHCPLPECEGEVVPIDDDMATTILLLNDKGYLTANCCSGHIGDSCPNTYIHFLDQIEFPTKPKGFTVETKDLFPNLEGTVIRKRHDRKADPVKQTPGWSFTASSRGPVSYYAARMTARTMSAALHHRLLFQ